MLGIEVMDFRQLTINLSKAKDHDPYSAHRIEFFLILLVTKGSYTHFVDFKSYQLSEGSTIFVAKNQVHFFNKILPGTDGFCIIFRSPFIDKHYFLTDGLKINRLFNYHIESPTIHQKEMEPDSLVGIAHKLYAEYVYPSDFNKSEMLRSLLHIVLLQAERAKEMQSLVGIKAHRLELFNAFRNILESEYANTRNSRVYASKLFISYKYLNDIVKEMTSKTVKAFIDDFVTIEIKRYLIATGLSVNEISYKTGFEEPANMIKFFKKNVGTTPLKFRKQL